MEELNKAFDKYDGTHVKMIASREYDKPIVMEPTDEYTNMAAGIITLDKAKRDNEFRIKKSKENMNHSMCVVNFHHIA